MTEIIRSPDTETYQASNRSTVAQWMHERLEVFCTHAVKPLTLASYESIFRNYISLRIGAMQLQEVRGTHIQRIFNDMIADGSSAKTVKNVAAVLHKSLSVALKQWLIQQNPCDATGMPKAQKPEIQLLSDSEIPRLSVSVRTGRNGTCLCVMPPRRPERGRVYGAFME